MFDIDRVGVMPQPAECIPCAPGRNFGSARWAFSNSPQPRGNRGKGKTMNQWYQQGIPEGQAPPPIPPAPKRSSLAWLWITLAALGGMFVGCTAGVGIGAAPSASRSVPSVSSPSAGGAGSSAATAEAPVVPSGPLTMFGNSSTTGSSMFEIGTGLGQVPPGRYFTEGGAYCYYELTRTGTGNFGDIVTNEPVGEGQGFVTIPEKGAGFIKVNGVCKFTKK